MKKIIIFGVFALVLMAINVSQNMRSKQNEFSLDRLLYANIAFASEGEGGGGSGPLWHDLETSILCSAYSWEKTEYFNSNHSLLGTLLIQGGIIKTEYHGEYHSTTYSSGTTPARYLTMKECPDGWDPFCTPCTDPCKGC